MTELEKILLQTLEDMDSDRQKEQEILQSLLQTSKDSLATTEIQYREIKKENQILKKEVGLLQDSLIDLSDQLEILGRRLR